ncbi:hypothetical protein ORV05_25435 [Amycolatopsis cynarae]|uniref:Transposase n=1 Tax=Amycolatopsis cynarae TaxID=2995223 RepID=A0ABY7AWG2_9PSEU|nr:hypothetical protein [Amycolatopsis sp. HUAS 11-8]WAL64296.1 hypothetical protein ORV05_25435 [Amycolatopsis sp. HUAS 11-8]
MDFESVSDELYAARREEFTALREERARQARGDRQLAKRIAGLRKPTVAAWLVNQVARSCPEEIDRLAKLGEALRDAHQRLAGAELRALSQERHELAGLLVQRAHWLARKAGYGVGDTTERQLGETFEAAVSDSHAADAVRAARLSTSLIPGSAEEWFSAAVVSAKTGPKPVSGKTRPQAKPREDAERKQQRAARDKAREKARTEAKEAEQTLAQAERALREAERDSERAAQRVAELTERLADAKKTAQEKRTAVTLARKTAAAARRTAAAAARRAADLA